VKLTLKALRYKPFLMVCYVVCWGVVARNFNVRWYTTNLKFTDKLYDASVEAKSIFENEVYLFYNVTTNPDTWKGFNIKVLDPIMPELIRVRQRLGQFIVSVYPKVRTIYDGMQYDFYPQDNLMLILIYLGPLVIAVLIMLQPFKDVMILVRSFNFWALGSILNGIALVVSLVCMDIHLRIMTIFVPMSHIETPYTPEGKLCAAFIGFATFICVSLCALEYMSAMEISEYVHYGRIVTLDQLAVGTDSVEEDDDDEDQIQTRRMPQRRRMQVEVGAGGQAEDAVFDTISKAQMPLKEKIQAVKNWLDEKKGSIGNKDSSLTVDDINREITRLDLKYSPLIERLEKSEEKSPDAKQPDPPLQQSQAEAPAAPPPPIPQRKPRSNRYGPNMKKLLPAIPPPPPIPSTARPSYPPKMQTPLTALPVNQTQLSNLTPPSNPPSNLTPPSNPPSNPTPPPISRRSSESSDEKRSDAGKVCCESIAGCSDILAAIARSILSPSTILLVAAVLIAVVAYQKDVSPFNAIEIARIARSKQIPTWYNTGQLDRLATMEVQIVNLMSNKMKTVLVIAEVVKMLVDQIPSVSILGIDIPGDFLDTIMNGFTYVFEELINQAVDGVKFLISQAIAASGFGLLKRAIDLMDTMQAQFAKLDKWDGFEFTTFNPDRIFDGFKVELGFWQLDFLKGFKLFDIPEWILIVASCMTSLLVVAITLTFFLPRTSSFSLLFVLRKLASAAFLSGLFTFVTFLVEAKRALDKYGVDISLELSESAYLWVLSITLFITGTLLTFLDEDENDMMHVYHKQVGLAEKNEEERLAAEVRAKMEKRNAKKQPAATGSSGEMKLSEDTTGKTRRKRFVEEVAQTDGVEMGEIDALLDFRLK
jgi:hypothetical protein